MAIQPIDLQLMMNRTTEVNNPANHQNQRYDAQQQAFNYEFQQQVERSANQINQTNKSEENNIKDGQGGNKGQYKGKKKGQKKNEEKNVKKNKSSSLFDVSI